MARVTKDYNLQVINLYLSKEWHPSKNGPLAPANVTPNSGKKVWWLCRNGHEWEAKIYHRNNGSGCPYCSGQAVSEDNCLQSIRPKLSKEWHPYKNRDLTPKDLTPGSHKKVWWICKRGHEWQAEVKSRSAGQGCPYCYSKTSQVELRIYSELKALFYNVKHRKKVTGAECDIFLSDLNIGIEVDGYYWHKNRYSRDEKKTNFLFEKGISLIRVREKGLKKISEKDIVYSEKSDELKVIKDILTEISKRIRMSGPLRHRINVYLNNGVLVNDVYYKKLLEMLPSPLPGFSLKDRNRKLAKEWHPTKNGNLTPQDVTINSHKKVWWLCNRGHEWKAIISNRTKGRGCPYCSGKMVCEDNCLLIKNSTLAFEWHSHRNGSLTPKNVTEYSHKKVWWLCEKGHEYFAKVSDRSKGTGCPFCAGKIVCENNCLQTVNATLASEWHPTKNADLTPKDVTPGSHKNVWWLCEKGHEWKALISNRTNGTGCPYCAGKAVCEDNCLLTVNPSLALEWHPAKNGTLTPKDIMPNSGKKVWWVCKQGHEWKAFIYHRNKGIGCPYCSGKLPTGTYNLRTVNPVIANQWHPVKNGVLAPENVMPNSHKKVWWLCSKGHEWQAQIASRNRGNNCPYCSSRRKI